MVASEDRLARTSISFESVQHVSPEQGRWLPSFVRLVFERVRAYIAGDPDSMLHSVSTSQVVASAKVLPTYDWTLPERSLLMFRRENQGESFDDDVAALRDRVGSGQREQPEPAAEPAEDQTTYSPPRQTWRPVTQSTESGLDPTMPQQTAWQPAETDGASVVAADTSWEGSVTSSGSLHIHGTVSGQVQVDGDMYIAEGATVNAEVNAGGVTVAGTLEGNVECSGRFEVLPSGRVSANVAAPRLVVHEGARVVGKLRMTTGD